MPTYADLIKALLAQQEQQSQQQSVTPNSGNSFYDGLAKIGNALGITTTKYDYPTYDTFISDPTKYVQNWNNMSLADQNTYIKNTYKPVNTGTDTTYSAPTTTTTFNNGALGTVGSGLAQAAQVGLAIVDRFQADKAQKIAKDQFNKQYQFAINNAKNQEETNRLKTLSGINISSGLMNKSSAEAANRYSAADAKIPNNFGSAKK